MDDMQADLSQAHSIHFLSESDVCERGKYMRAHPQCRGRWIKLSHIYRIFTSRRPSMTETLLTVPLNLNTNQTKH